MWELMYHMPAWQLVLAVVFSWLVGFLSGAGLFYQIGRRHGIDAMAQAWREAIRRDREPMEHI